MSYSYSDIITALQATRRTWKFIYHVLDDQNKQVFDVNVSSCSVTNSDLADIKRTADITMMEADAAQINFATWRIQPVVRLLMPDDGWQEWPLGVFLMSAPTKVHATGAVQDRKIAAYDLGKVLRDDLVTDRYTVAAGTRYTTAITTVLTSAGLPTGSIGRSTATLPAAREWDPGTSKYVIINDLLSAINYASLSFDGNGVPYAVPYISPSEAPSLYTYDVGPAGVIMADDGVEETLDYGSVPNVFVLYVSSPDLTSSGAVRTLRSVYTNSNPLSPTSTVNVERSIVSYQQVMDIADQATLDAAAKKAADQASQVYSQVTFSTGLMPIHTTADAMMIDWGDGPIKYRETKWTMDLRAGGKMQHEVRRVVNV